MKTADQIERIKRKLETASATKDAIQVFGASSHRYILNPPVDETVVTAFEHHFGITLPECYRSFVTQIGSGGIGYMNSGAGPFYGIFPFGKHLDFFGPDPKLSLRLPVKIFPGMAKEEWEELVQIIYADEEVPDDVYEKAELNMHGGLLTIGSQGCTYYHALLLNGQHKGKVVNLDADGYKPIFTHEANFLDWYERWLDEVISGKLVDQKIAWFGYNAADN
ncbi:MAG: SMI1/KNR4 family protein [Bacteroidota bacterium]